MFEALMMMLVMQPLPGQDLATPVVPRAAPSASVRQVDDPANDGIADDATPPMTLIAENDAAMPRDRAVEHEEASAADDEAYADPARQWGWLFEHGSRHHGPAAPRFDHDARHVF